MCVCAKLTFVIGSSSAAPLYNLGRWSAAGHRSYPGYLMAMFAVGMWFPLDGSPRALSRGHSDGRTLLLLVNFESGLNDSQSAALSSALLAISHCLEVYFPDWGLVRGQMNTGAWQSIDISAVSPAYQARATIANANLDNGD